MPDYNLTNTAADIDQALQDAVNLVTPLAASTNSTTAYGDNGNGVSAEDAAVAISNAHNLLAPAVGQTLYHTGNTGLVEFGNNPVSAGENKIVIGGVATKLLSGRGSTSASSHQEFYNPNGQIGSISTSGVSTAYNTSSDPRLKDFLPDPTDADIDDYFTRVLNSAAVFTWKADPDKKVVWGFDAHKAADNGLHMASEGEGPREMAIGEVYQEAVLDEDGNELEPEKKVTSAGIDQAKDFAALVFKTAQQDRVIKELIQRIQALEGV